MKILVITYAFGVTSSGKSTKNIVNELKALGNEVFICACLCQDDEQDENLLKIENKFSRPARFFSFLGDLILRDINYFFWQKKTESEIFKIAKKQKFDLIYSRGSPAVSFYVGNKISQSLNIPLALHFADPIPATKDWSPGQRYRKKMIRSIEPAVKNANILTFANKEMFFYQERMMSSNIGYKSIVVPNPIPIYQKLEEIKGEEFVIGYTGQFGKSRNSHIILKSVLKIIKMGFKVKLLFVGTRDIDINTKDFINISSDVEVLPYVENLKDIYERINLFIDIDSDYKEQVFVSNKLMEYLSINRPILSITSESSPASKLLQQLTETVYKSNHNIESVSDNLLLAIKNKNKEYDYTERDIIRFDFGTSNIVKSLYSKFIEVVVN